MKSVTEEQRDQLRAPLPAEAVTKHPTKTYLSSIKAIYVVERINDVFGIGSWNLKTNMVERADGGNVVVKTEFSIPEYNIYLESFGGNDNGGATNKNFDLGDAFKGATTDSITKIASYLEIGIDVFKGKGNKAEPKTPAKSWKTSKLKDNGSQQQKSIAKPSVLDELTPTHKSWNYVVGRVKDKVPLDKIKESFTLSPENEEKLIKAASLVITEQIANK